MTKRKSYPSAEAPDYCIGVLQFIKETAFPKSLASRLTRKYKNKFPVLYDIILQKHLTSAYFELLEMLGLCGIIEKTDEWFVFEFSKSLKRASGFKENQIKGEVLDISKEFRILEKIEAYSPSKEGIRLLELRKNDNKEFRLSCFYKFFRLEPPYFRFAIQHPRINKIWGTRKRDLQNHLFQMIKEAFPTFIKDDTARILGWSEYFKILKKDRKNGSEGYNFSINAIVQYVGHALSYYLNDKCQQITHHNWQDLESDLYRDIFFRNSLLRPESFIEILLDQNPGKYRWGIIERGPGRYKGFRGNPAWQLLQVRETPLSYQYQPYHVSKVVKS